MRDLDLRTNSDEIDASQVAVRRFGGIQIYASSEHILKRGIGLVTKGILQVSNTSPGLNPNFLKFLVQQNLGIEIPKRIFSAILGSQLRAGVLEEVTCQGSKGTPFRVIIHRDRVREFNKRVDEVALSLLQSHQVQISAIRERFFPGKSKGAWTLASYIAARLVRIGWAIYVDPYRIELPEPVKNAAVRAELLLGRPNLERMGAGG